MNRPTEEDLQLVHRLRRQNVLEDVASHKINGNGRNVVIMCSDGHQSPDVITSHSRFLQHNGDGECCCHSHMLNGGALLLSPMFTETMKLPVREVLLHQIKQSLSLKDINTVALYVHAPCGAAGLRKLSFIDTLVCLFDAKFSLKCHFFRFKKLHVSCFVQIDYGPKKRTYFISRSKWESWIRDPSYCM